MKCERCGQKEIRQEGLLLVEEDGPEAEYPLYLKGTKGLLTAKVCLPCKDSMIKLGWKES